MNVTSHIDDIFGLPHLKLNSDYLDLSDGYKPEKIKDKEDLLAYLDKH